MGIIAENVQSSRVLLDNGGKNYIINGGFDYWNYATTQSISGYGSDDRWVNGNSGSTKTHSRISSTDLERGFFNSSFFSRTVVTSVAGVSNYASKSQRIENVTKFAGKTVTISFWAKADITKNISVEFSQVFGTGGTPSASVTGIGSQLIQLTSTWQKKSVTVSIPSIVGKTIGTDGDNSSYTEMTFWFEAGSTYATRAASLGQQSGTFDIAQVKVEEGTVATPWTPYEGEFGGELQACQRYYEVIIPTAQQYVVIDTTGNFRGSPNSFKVVKRVLPTCALIGTPAYYNGTNNNITVYSLFGTLHSVNISGTISGRTTYQALCEVSSDSIIKFTISAEL